MGALYKIRCERCGIEFEHQTGAGFTFACVGCGEVVDNDAPFWCPCCQKRYDPQKEDFSDKITEVILWD